MTTASPLAFLLSILVNSGELTPNITRNQIQPTYYQGYQSEGYASPGYWSGEPEERAIAVLNDLRRFGLSRVVIEANYQIASSQYKRSGEIRTYNQEWVFYQWEREVSCRMSAWLCLAYAAEPSQALVRRLYWLDQLIDEIGIDNYMAGIMPNPAPFYKNGGQ